MGSNLDAIVEEGYHLEEAHIYGSYQKEGTKPNTNNYQHLITDTLENHQASPIAEYA